ncbi:hypothetical protein GQ457_11G014580 [Hibiscus cannabinus]
MKKTDEGKTALGDPVATVVPLSSPPVFSSTVVTLPAGEKTPALTKRDTTRKVFVNMPMRSLNGFSMVDHLAVSQGGRPPDGSVIVVDGDALERPGSPVHEGSQPVQKKVRSIDAPGTEGVMIIDEDLSGNLRRDASSTQPVADEVDVRADDVRLGGSSTLPEIQFSNRVHDAIDAKLANSVVIRLLGKSIGYRALLNLQPWSRHFSTDEAYPSQIMVWVRLPKLAYRYYTKNLFRHIAAAIGKVVKIDYNMTEGKRGRFARLAIMVDLNKPLVLGIVIDGHRQDIEYEGLPAICYKCGRFGHSQDDCGGNGGVESAAATVETPRDPSELYGPWMQVSHRRRRPGMHKTIPIGGAGSKSAKTASGSRFMVLEEEQEGFVDMGGDQEATGNNSRMEGLRGRDGRVEEVEDAPPRMVLEKPGQLSSGQGVHLNEANVGSSKDVVVRTDGECRVMGTSQVAPSFAVAHGKVVNSKSVLEAGKHSAVQIMDGEGGHSSKIVKGRVLPGTLRGGTTKIPKPGIGAKGNLKLGVKPTKCDERGRVNPGLSSCLSSLVSELDKVVAVEKERLSDSVNDQQTLDGQVQWRANSTYDRQGVDDMQDKKPDMVACFEPRISGRQADKVIKLSGFELSFRVEAHGFSGGIWVLWRDTVRFDILVVSNQFVHGFCVPKNGGDLNVIGSSDERKGGALGRSGVCSHFCDFMLNYGLLDMGFNGPQFTWRRGTLFQRLDRCLCNRSWYVHFARSEVFHLPKLGSDHRPIMLDSGVDFRDRGNMPFRYVVAWNEHEDFADMLASVWEMDCPLSENLSKFQEKSRKWNIDVFGHIEKRKRCLIARLKGIERELEKDANLFLEELERELKRELDVVLAQEESLWHQKARSRWIENGDRNTRFFHASTMSRRKHNTISMLRIGGSWCEDKERLQDHAIQDGDAFDDC